MSGQQPGARGVWFDDWWVPRKRQGGTQLWRPGSKVACRAATLGVLGTAPSGVCSVSDTTLRKGGGAGNWASLTLRALSAVGAVFLFVKCALSTSPLVPRPGPGLSSIPQNGLGERGDDMQWGRQRGHSPGGGGLGITEKPGPGRARHLRSGLALPSTSCPTSHLPPPDQASVSRSLKWESWPTDLHYCIIKMMLWGSGQGPLTFPRSCPLPPRFCRRLPEPSCDPPKIPAPSGRQPQAVPLAVLSQFGKVTAVSEHLLPMASVQGEAPALPLTSTSTEQGQASCACTNRN